MGTIETLAAKIRSTLQAAVQRHPADGLLLSGGIDSGILALCVPSSKALTVRLESYGDDIDYAHTVAQHLGMDHEVEVIGIDQAFDAIPEAIKTLRSFTPLMPNKIAALIALRQARRRGIQTVMTGDAADELFAGYSYMQKQDDLGGYIRDLAKRMRFTTGDLARHVGIGLSQPYRDPEFVNLALEIEPELKVVTEDGKTWGKWILRKAFEDALPPSVVWQEKRPFELGSGFTALRELIDARIPDDEYKEKVNAYPVRFYGKEHLYYYEIYERVVGEIPPPGPGEKACQGCGGGIPISESYCRTCGWVQDRELSSESFRLVKRRGSLPCDPA